jgi:signal peptidase II
MTFRSVRGWVFFAAALVFIADRLTKYVIVNSLTAAESIRVIPGIFHVTLVLNNGAAFGIFRNMGVMFILMTFVAVALILLYVLRSKAMSAPVMAAFGLILGGALGNLVDRIKFGYVIDFLDFRVWPVFNIADSAITVGAAILVLTIFIHRAKL